MDEVFTAEAARYRAVAPLGSGGYAETIRAVIESIHDRTRWLVPT